jgi:hypothetical protein
VKALALTLLFACGGSSPPLAPAPQPREVPPVPVLAPAEYRGFEVGIATRADETLPAGTGALDGTIADHQLETVSGLTVVAASGVLLGHQVAITDEKGWFQIPHLPAGRYDVSFYYGDITRMQALDVVAGRITTLKIVGWR